MNRTSMLPGISRRGWFRTSFAAGLIICLTMGTLIPSAAIAEEPTETETLKVLAYNIHMWQPGVEPLAGVLRKSEADIIGLNEAWNEQKNLQLAKKLGYNIVFGGQSPTKTYPQKPHTINGFHMPQVLLTKHKIVSSKVFNAMATKENEAFDPAVPIYRGGTMAVLETKHGTRLLVFVLHLHPWGDGQNEKMINMRMAEINGILKVVESQSPLPTLLIGDFNILSHLDGFPTWKVSQRLQQAGYHDLYRTLKPDPKTDPGLTNGPGRIDFIFYKGKFTPKSTQVLKPGVFGSKGFAQSDHLGVFGELKLLIEKR